MKQENFCLAYLETGNATEAYRRSYDAGNMNDGVIGVKANELLNNGKITVRLDELRKPIMKRHNITIDSLLDELEEARQLALQTEKSAAAVSASMGKAKILGLDKQIIEHTSPDGSMTPAPSVVISSKEIKEALNKLNEEC